MTGVGRQRGFHQALLLRAVRVLGNTVQFSIKRTIPSGDPIKMRQARFSGDAFGDGQTRWLATRIELRRNAKYHRQSGAFLIDLDC
jgi:hypothetical protein